MMMMMIIGDGFLFGGTSRSGGLGVWMGLGGERSSLGLSDNREGWYAQDSSDILCGGRGGGLCQRLTFCVGAVVGDSPLGLSDSRGGVVCSKTEESLKVLV
jgi:hypothetical protein